MQEKLLRLLKVYEDEISLLLWTAAVLFIIRSSGIILNNYAETAFLKRYGVEYMPIVNMLNAVATFFITGFMTAFLGKIPGARILAYLFIFSGLLVTVIRLLIPMGIDLLYPLLFMLKSQLELLQALLFWNMCNDLFNTRQSKRIFPLLTAGGVIGLILGSFGTPYFARMFQLDNLLYLYFCTTLLGAGIVISMGRSFPTLLFPEKAGGKGKNKDSMIQEFKKVYPLIKDSLLIKIVLVLTFMPNVVIPIMNYQFNYAVNDQFASETAMIEFFGYFRGVLNIISLFILLFVGRIYGRWGLPVALMFHPFNYMIAFFAYLFRFDIFSAMYSRMSTNVIRTTINMPANGILLGLFPESYRNMIRPFLRGTVVRLALFVGSGLILISEPLFHPRYLTLVALPFLLAWVAAPFFLKKNYARILMDLVSKNQFDFKSLDEKELGQIFKEGQVLDQLEDSFLAARGKDAVWYAQLLQNLSPERLDKTILENLEHQDDDTKIALIKMISPQFLEKRIKALLPFLDPEKPEGTIAILKIIAKQGFDVIKGLDMTRYLDNPHPVVRGFTLASLFVQDREKYEGTIQQWMNSSNIQKQQSGIVAAGLSGKRSYIDPLLSFLSRKDIYPILPDIIIALSRLKAVELNQVIYEYLAHKHEDVRMAALDALEINDDVSLKKTISLLGDTDDDIHEFAKQKIRSSQFQNNQLLIESLGIPGMKIRESLFELLENLDIKEFDVLMFGKTHANKCYEYLAMYENLENRTESRLRDLVRQHLLEKKELGLENIIRVLAIHDPSRRTVTAWRGIYSPDTKQRANAVELLSDIMDRKLFNAMLPLLESPTPAVALSEGRTAAKIPTLDSQGRDVITRLLISEEWVDVIMGLNLVHDTPSLLKEHELSAHLQQSFNPHISKEIQMILKKADSSIESSEKIRSTDIPLGEKILLLKEIDMFSDLSAAELAAISTVTKELDYPENRTVIKQGDMGETVFLIIDGQVEVIKEQENGRELVLDKIGAGDAFGEMALLEDEPRSATIRTIEPSRFLILHKQEFNETVMEYPRIALKICRVLSSRIRHLHVEIQKKTNLK